MTGAGSEESPQPGDSTPDDSEPETVTVQGYPEPISPTTETGRDETTTSE